MEGFEPIKIAKKEVSPENTPSPIDIRDKSTSPYIHLQVGNRETDADFYGPEQVQENEDFKNKLSNILNDNTVLEKLAQLGKIPEGSYVSEEFKKYISDVKNILGEEDGQFARRIATGSAYSVFEPNDLVKDISILEALGRYSSAYRSAELMTDTEAYARKYINQNNSEIGKIVDGLNLKYTQPDSRLFSIHRKKGGEYVVLLTPSEEEPASAETAIRERIKLAHELYHAVFDELTLPQEAGSVTLDIDYSNSFHTITEGFATIMELHLNKSMRDAPEEYGLKDEEVEQLEKIQQERLRYLANRTKENKHLQYWEGVQSIFHDLMDEKSVSGVLEFVKQLDIQKIVALDNKNPIYQKLVAEKDYTKWLEYLQK